MAKKHFGLLLPTILVAIIAGAMIAVATQKTSPPQEQVAKEQTFDFPVPLLEEETGIIETITTPYDKKWAIIHDPNHYSFIDGRFILFDSNAKSKSYKGAMHGGYAGGFDISKNRNLIYISTTYHSRGISGKRTDIIAIHNPQNLEKIDEIIIPPKRGSNFPFKNSFRLSGDESLGFVYNFTPAASISIVDMAARKFLHEIPIPGCTLAYPMGTKGFASMCGDGTMLGVSLDGSGNVVKETRSVNFNNIDDDSLFLKYARFGDVLYFPTFTGNIQPVDLSSDTPRPLAKWSLVGKGERVANWRPGGYQLIAGDGSTIFYVLMHADGGEGTQKNGGPEVWIYSITKQKRIGKIKLKTWGLSLAVAGDNLIVTNAEMQLDIYDLKSREFSHTFGDGLITPLIVYTVQGD